MIPCTNTQSVCAHQAYEVRVCIKYMKRARVPQVREVRAHIERTGVCTCTPSVQHARLHTEHTQCCRVQRAHKVCVNLKRAKHECTHQAHEVHQMCVRTTSGRSIYMHTTCILNVCSVLDHTNRPESACAHQAHKVHVCASSARNVRVVHQAPVVCACTPSAQGAYMHTKCKEKCACAQQTYAVCSRTLSTRCVCGRINFMKYVRVHRAHEACPCRPTAPSAYAHQAHGMCAYEMRASPPSTQNTKHAKCACGRQVRKVCAYPPTGFHNIPISGNAISENHSISDFDNVGDPVILSLQGTQIRDFPGLPRKCFWKFRDNRNSRKCKRLSPAHDEHQVRA